MRDLQYLTPAHDVLSYEADGRTVVLDLGMDGWAAAVAAGPAAYVALDAGPSLDDYRRAVQSHIEATAIARRYDSAASCASYVASTNPAWAAEAQAFVAWRDAVWAQIYAAEAGHDPEAAPPTIEALIASLPAIVWP